jgi:hypothetical protein
MLFYLLDFLSIKNKAKLCSYRLFTQGFCIQYRQHAYKKKLKTNMCKLKN